MANELTGDFDVVAEFTVPAANRVLAAMHLRERFLHSQSVRVDDRPPRGFTPDTVVSPDRARVPTIVGVVNAYGQAVADPRVLVEATEQVSTFYAVAAGTSMLDQPVTAASPLIEREELLPIHVTGVALVQLAAPTLEPHPGSETRITLSNRVLVRYFQEEGSRTLPRYLRGVVRISVDVDRVASQVGDVLDVNLKASNTDVTFTREWSDVAPTADQETAIEKTIKKAVLTSFQPSNVKLSSDRSVQLKTLPGALPAICVLVGAPDVSGDPASVGTVFLGGGDHFAFAVSGEFLAAEFKRHVDDALTRKGLRTFIHRFVRHVLGFKVADISWTITIDDVTVALADGEIRMTLHGRGTTSNSRLNFTFRAHQAFTLKLEGETAALEIKGDLFLEVPSGGLTALMINVFKNQAVEPLRDKRNLAVDDAQPKVRETLHAQANLGGFLTSLINPPPIDAPENIKPTLTYTSFEIKASGLILRGELSVPPWPEPRVEFELTPWNASAGVKEYSALNTWIPGGAIYTYVWRRQGATLKTEKDRFVYVEGAPLFPISAFQTGEAVHAAMQAAGSPAESSQPPLFSAMCLTAEGKRLSASGPVVEEDVSATHCAWPAVSLTMVTDSPAGRVAAQAAAQAGGASGRRRLPDMALTRIAASGALEVVGHASPWAVAPTPGTDRPNLIVHFADERSAADLGFLANAVRQSGRTDAASAIVAVLSREALARARPPEGVIVTDDSDGAWKDLFGVERPPVTVLVDPSGRIAWRQDGEPGIERLAPALRERLVAGGPVVPRVLDSAVRVGHRPPNFVFTHAPGRELTLRKLVGRPVMLAFVKATSPPSLDTLRLLEAGQGQGKGASQRTVVLAVHQGGVVPGGAASIMVPDVAGAIAHAYGISVWPTTVAIDALGVVTGIHHGRLSREQAGYGADSRRAD